MDQSLKITTMSIFSKYPYATYLLVSSCYYSPKEIANLTKAGSFDRYKLFISSAAPKAISAFLLANRLQT